VNDKIEGLLADGRALLASGRPHDAAFAFERVLLLVPTDGEARSGLEAAHAASAEQDLRVEERLAAAERGDRIPARGWFALRRADGEPDATIPAGAPAGRSRLVLGVTSGALFVMLGAAVAGNWNGLMRRLAQAPVPHETAIALTAQPAPRTDDQTIAAAQRLLAAGDAARAVELLDSVHPQQPSYPFARQLRGQAERALRERSAGAGR
jgi:hypothetical protein